MGITITPGKTSTSTTSSSKTTTATSIVVGGPTYVALPEGYKISNGTVLNSFGRTQSRYNGKKTVNVNGTTYVLDQTATSVAESIEKK